MRLQLLGIERLDYKFSDGNEFHGVRLHGIDLDRSNDEKICGQAVDTVVISDDISDRMPDFEIGNSYMIGFARGSKKVDIVLPVT